MPGCAGEVSGCRVGVACRRASLSPRDFPACPRPPEVDRPTRTLVVRPCPLEVVEHVLRAVGRPHREEAMVPILEAAAPAQRDEPRITDLGEDHSRLSL